MADILIPNYHAHPHRITSVRGRPCEGGAARHRCLAGHRRQGVLSYVGYYYNTELRDCVFILPKVLMNEQDLVFGKYSPEAMIHFEHTEPMPIAAEGQVGYETK